MTRKRGRHCSSGKILSVEEANALGPKAIVETVSDDQDGREVELGRDGASGRFVGLDETVKRPRETVVQTVRR